MCAGTTMDIHETWINGTWKWRFQGQTSPHHSRWIAGEFKRRGSMITGMYHLKNLPRIVKHESNAPTEWITEISTLHLLNVTINNNELNRIFFEVSIAIYGPKVVKMLGTSGHESIMMFIKMIHQLWEIKKNKHEHQNENTCFCDIMKLRQVHEIMMLIEENMYIIWWVGMQNQPLASYNVW